jgi:hypothetical protein
MTDIVQYATLQWPVVQKRVFRKKKQSFGESTKVAKKRKASGFGRITSKAKTGAGATIAPLSKEQKKRDFELKLCHKCHQRGHQAKQCPLNRKKGGKVAAVGGKCPSERRVVGGGFLGSLGAKEPVSREYKSVLDLTKQDFQTILNVTGRILEIGVHRSDGCLSSVVGPNSEILNDLKGKHVWLIASNVKDLAERIWHSLSACVLDPLSTSVCALIRQALAIDMSLLKDFRCVLTVPKGGLVR